MMTRLLTRQTLSAARAFLILCGFLICAAPPSLAGFKEGAAAYKQGDFRRAYQEWVPVAEEGDAETQFRLAALYAEGKGAPQDSREAARLYRAAADQNHAGAQYYLGRMYEHGTTVEGDDEEAVRWYMAAAEQGNLEARLALGRMYNGGKGVSQDEAHALYWFHKAAERNYQDAQFALGLMYKADGDYEEAYKWFWLASRDGPGSNAEAQQSLTALEKEMDPDDVEEAKQTAEQWREGEYEESLWRWFWRVIL